MEVLSAGSACAVCAAEYAVYVVVSVVGVERDAWNCSAGWPVDGAGRGCACGEDFSCFSGHESADVGS